MNAYLDREQTKAKHFILRNYLQALAFKVLHNWDIAYIDGFSGPWKAKTDDYSDTSFMIAISVLKDAQQRVFEATGRRRNIKCFFSEKNPESFRLMETAVMPYHDPALEFEIKTFHGEFVEAVSEIKTFMDQAFPLIFIDPTGWTEYPFTKIAPLFSGAKCETLINFMYGFISRFLSHPDEKIVASLDPILGGRGWKDRLDPMLPAGLAVEKLFRETLQAAGKFDYVVSTKIDKSTEERPHFFLAYGTKDRRGLITFRETEHSALKEHARDRAAAKTRKREARTGSPELFADFEADQHEASIGDLVEEQKKLAKARLLELLAPTGTLPFTIAVDALLQAYMLRETNVKDVCCDLAAEGKIERSWGAGNRKPNDVTVIKLNTES